MKRKLLTLLVLIASVFGIFTIANSNSKEAEAAVTLKGGEVLYFTTSNQWSADNPRYATYFFGSGEAWADMTLVEGKMYQVTVPAGSWTGFIFCRMNPSNKTNSWSTKWNQTGDLSFDGTNNHYTVKESTWDKGGGSWSVYKPAGEEVLPFETLAGIVSPFVNNGTYVRNTVINIDLSNEDVKKDLYYAFHAQSFETERTTYFYPDELWMTNANGVNSGYGTNANKEMYHFSYDEKGMKVVDYTVADSKGVEDWYVTLNDIVITEDQGWTVDANNVYTSKDETLLKQFLAFTAPCFLNFDDETEFFFSLDHVTINKTANNELVMSLYVKADSEGFLNNDDLLLSTATITYTEEIYTLPGEFNGWSTTTPVFHVTNVDGLYAFEVELEAKSYGFKVIKNGQWLGNDGTIEGTTHGYEWEFKNSVDSNCTMKVTTAGTYVFFFNPKTNGLIVTPKA